MCRSNRCCLYTPYSFGTLWLTIEITTSNHYQERMTVPDSTGLRLGLLEMEHFLIILVNKIRLILRRAQISIGISNIKTSKYSLTLTHSKPIPTFPLAFQSAVSNIWPILDLSFQINVVCLLSVLFFFYHCENKPWLFPKETFNGFVFVMEKDRTFCEVGTLLTAEQSALIRHTVQPFTESEDTRWCDNTICPPEDEHVNARNMSKIVM